MKYTFDDNVSHEHLATTRAAWLTQAQDEDVGASVFRYEQDLDYFQRVLGGAAMQGPGRLCGINSDVKGVYHALITASHNKPKSEKAYLKVLDLTLEPKLAAGDALETFGHLGWVIACALTGCLRLAGEGLPARDVKFYLNRKIDRDLLLASTSAVMAQPEFSSHWGVTGQSNWIVLSRVTA